MVAVTPTMATTPGNLKQVAEKNRQVAAVARIINQMVADNTTDFQTILFGGIAAEGGCSLDIVRHAVADLPNVGSSGVMFSVTPADREALAALRRRGHLA